LIKHAIHIVQDLIVPEAYGFISMHSKPLGSVAVRFRPARLCVLSSVKLNNKLCIVADEIRDKGSEQDLPPEAYAEEPMGPQTLPQLALGIGHIGAQPSGIATLTLGEPAMRHYPPPWPSPLRGEGNLRRT
jgi:hypothetical protein